MSTLQFSEEENIGGIQLIQLAPAFAFESLAPAVTFRDGYSWDDALILPESGQLTDEQAETDNGTQYTYNLVFNFNKKRMDLQAALSKYVGTIAIAKVTDQNGFTQIIGNLEAPLTLKLNGDSGKRPSDPNQMPVNAACITRLAALTLA